MPDPAVPAVRQKSGRNALLAAAIVMLVAGYAAGTYLGGAKSYQKGLADGQETARQDITAKLEESGLLPPELPLLSVSGTVTSVDGDVLTIEVPQAVRNPLAEPAPTVRKVTLAGAEVVTRSAVASEERDAAFVKFVEEQRAYNAAVARGETPDAPPTPPVSYAETKAAASDIRVGARVTVETSEDVLRAASFAAKRVGIDYLPPVDIGAAPAAVSPDAEVPSETATAP